MFTSSPFADYAARLAEIIRGFDAVSPADRSCSSLTEIDFDSLARNLFAVQFEQNLAYRRICEVRGCSPANVMSWTNIPPVPTTAFKELEISSVPRPDRQGVF